MQSLTSSPVKETRARPVPLSAQALPAAAWSITRSVHFSDCDPAGIVYTPRFIDMVNGVIEDFFIQKLGVDYHRMIQTDRVGLGYANVNTDFFRPALMGDHLRFIPLVTHVGQTSVIYSVHCLREAEEVMRCRLVMVLTSLDSHTPIAIPAALKNALISYRDKCL